jgi:hypothetical protein
MDLLILVVALLALVVLVLTQDEGRPERVGEPYPRSLGDRRPRLAGDQPTYERPIQPAGLARR